MTEVTDKMVEAARAAAAAASCGQDGRWRAAIDAALDAREPADARDAIAAIEELVEALKPFARIRPSSLHSPDGSENEGYAAYLADRTTAIEFTGKDMARACALLTRMGVKL